MAYLDNMDYMVENLPLDLLKEFGQVYYAEYNHMYDNNDIPSDGFDYMEMLDIGDELIKAHMPLVSQFARCREDPISSDREVVAFTIAAIKCEYLWYV